MSEAVERRIVALLDKPLVCPHGNPIPGLDELGLPFAHDRPSRRACSRLTAAARAEARVITVDRISEQIQPDAQVMHRLKTAQLRPGGHMHVRAVARRRRGVDTRQAVGAVRPECQRSHLRPPRDRLSPAKWAVRPTSGPCSPRSGWRRPGKILDDREPPPPRQPAAPGTATGPEAPSPQNAPKRHVDTHVPPRRRRAHDSHRKVRGGPRSPGVPEASSRRHPEAARGGAGPRLAADLPAGSARSRQRAGRPVHGLWCGVLPQRLSAGQPDPRVERVRGPRRLCRGQRPPARDEQFPRVHRLDLPCPV